MAEPKLSIDLSKDPFWQRARFISPPPSLEHCEADHRSSIRALTMPFAARLLGAQSAFKSERNIRNLRHFYFPLGWREDMWTYFPLDSEGSFFYNLKVHKDYFLLHPPHPRRLSANRVKQSVRTWDFQSTEVLYNPARVKRQSNWRAPVKDCCLDPAGWHQPAHFGSSVEFGLHLSQGGLVNAAHEIGQLCPKEPADVVLATTCQFVYCHLLAHAWIEDICAMLDFAAFCKSEVNKRRYFRAHAARDGWILAEEILCNAMALCSLPAFLDSAKYGANRNIPKFRPKSIIQAIYDWAGKRTVEMPMEIDLPLHKNGPLLAATESLLRSVYVYGDDHAIREVISSMFAAYVHAGYGKLALIDGLPQEAIGPLTTYNEYPVFLHLD